MMQTTLRKIRAASPCGMRLEGGERVGYLKLRHYLGKYWGDDTPIDITTIIDSNGLDDALWCLRAVDGHAREMRLYAVWCARQVQSLVEDPRSEAALDVAERYANGAASNDELAAAREAAWDAARDAACEAAWAAARAAREAAGDAAWATAWAAAWAAGDAAGAAREAARDACEAACGATRAVQAAELRRICAEIEAGRKTNALQPIESAPKDGREIGVWSAKRPGHKTGE